MAEVDLTAARCAAIPCHGYHVPPWSHSAKVLAVLHLAGLPDRAPVEKHPETRLACDPELGGLGMPQVAGAAANEFFDGANLGLAVSLLLSRGAGELIEHYGTPELRRLFCEKLYTGEWAGTMCLTEPQAGSDVGASTTKAVERGDGRYLISGEKIFITYGDHDMTDNVLHTVLARLPDAPGGAKGLSLFAVPKIRVRADGTLGEANDVRCASIEHKLGIHGSPTCSMLFGADGACEGYLIGEENAGLKLMFQLMNAARLEVGSAKKRLRMMIRSRGGRLANPLAIAAQSARDSCISENRSSGLGSWSAT